MVEMTCPICGKHILLDRANGYYACGGCDEDGVSQVPEDMA